MALQNVNLGQTWVQIADGVDFMDIQSHGTSLLYFGSSEPSSSSQGFLIRSGHQHQFTNVSGLGGSVWARASSLIGASVMVCSGVDTGTVFSSSSSLGAFTSTQGLTFGTYADGVPYLVVPSGSTNVNMLPAQTTIDGQPVHGAQLNPTQTNDQGYDGRLPDYNAARNVGDSVSVTAGDVLVKYISVDTTPSQTREGMAQEIQVLHVVDSAPSANMFSPAAIGWTGRGTPIGHVVDIAAQVASLPTFDTSTHDRPSFADIIKYVDNDLSLFAQYGQNAFWYENYAPASIQDGQNYGGNFADKVGAAMLALISSDFTTPQKEALAARIVNWGIQWWDAFKGNGTPLGPDGGHFQFHLGPVCLALEWTGRSAELSDVLTTMGGNFLQAFQVTAGQVAHFGRHTDLTQPFIWRERPVNAVSGNQVTIQTTRSGFDGDAAQASFVGGILTRPSDGATANVLSQDKTSIAANDTDEIVLTIDTQPGVPFAASDVVFVDSNYVPAAGEYNWTIRGVDHFSNFSPLAGAFYRNLNEWSAQVMFLKAAGIWNASFSAIEGYVVFANQADQPLGDDYPTHFGAFQSPFHLWEEDFWNEHWGAISSPITAPTVFKNNGNDASLRGDTMANLGSPNSVTYVFEGTFDETISPRELFGVSAINLRFDVDTRSNQNAVRMSLRDSAGADVLAGTTTTDVLPPFGTLTKIMASATWDDGAGNWRYDAYVDDVQVASFSGLTSGTTGAWGSNRFAKAFTDNGLGAGVGRFAVWYEYAPTSEEPTGTPDLNIVGEDATFWNTGLPSGWSKQGTGLWEDVS